MMEMASCCASQPVLRSLSSAAASSLPSSAPARAFLPACACRELSSSVLMLGLNRRTIAATGAAGLSTVAAGALVAAAGVLMAISMVAGRNKAQQASLAVKRGMELFVQGNVAGSLEEFDRALTLDPSQKPYLWQRGLSLYYLDRFAEGAAQFREDVAVNPNDTEEAIWCFLCEAQILGAEEARKQFLQVGQDRRPVMRTAYQLFKDGGDPQELVNQFKDGEAHEIFYANLYAGLYHESEKNEDAAKSAIVAACNSRYGLRSNDYMAMLAKVHCNRRNW